MKYIKVLLSCMIILLAMLTSSEIYQNYLSVFIEDFYCVTYYPQEGITQEKMICDIFEKAREHQLDIFYAEDVIVNWHQETIDLYGDERTKKTLSSQYDILYGQRNSLLTGSCEVRYHDYQQLSKKELAKEPIIEFKPPRITTRKPSTLKAGPIPGKTLFTGAIRAPEKPARAAP